MKIGLVTAEYAPMQGGVGDFTREIGRALAALGHQVHVITNFKYQTPNAESIEDGVHVERVIKRWDWGCLGALRDVVRQLELDVIDIQYQAAAYRMHPAINLLPLTRRADPFLRWPHPLPIAVTFHDLKVPYLFPKAGPLRYQAILALARYADVVIVTNPEDEAELRSQIWAQPAGTRNVRCQIARVPIGSNIAPFLAKGYNRRAWRAHWGVKPGETLIGYFGFLHPLKGGEVLVRALAELVAEGRAVKLLHIGGRTGSSDPDTNAAYAVHVESLARELNVANRMAETGFTLPRQVTANFLACDVIAMPFVEGASLRHGTLHAALAHGRAIVTTRPLVPIDELRDGENVLLVVPNDAHALASGILRVMDEPALRVRLERGAAELAREFSWDRIAGRTAEILERVIRGPSTFSEESQV